MAIKSAITATAIAIFGLFSTPFQTEGNHYKGASTKQDPFAGEEWYDQISTVKVNREPARNFFIPYPNATVALSNEASALTRDFARSSYYMSLNGTWKFRAVNKPADRIDNFWNPATFDVSNWDDITVPSNWQNIRNSDGSIKYDNPIYTNTQYPWDNFGGVVSLANPVKAPTIFNPVGHYRRTFTVPSDWDGRRVFASFQGVESAFYLWINGQKVGYAEDSYTQSEFDITKYLKAGENTMAVQVYRWSTGSYLENQDFIRLSGIFRDVFLYSKGEVELRDFFVWPTLNPDFKTGNLVIEATIRNFGKPSGSYTLEATLKNMDDSDVWSDGPLVVHTKIGKAATLPVSITTKASKAVNAPRLWFAEKPELYKLLLQLKAADGKVIETAVVRTGFRKIERVEIPNENRQMLLFNGKRILIRGTNRHETSLTNGRAITKAEIIQDLMNMKQNNINAIRTSHYPNNVITYDLADELGIYICDEANIESHVGANLEKPENRIPSNNPLWLNSVLDRTMSMVERDKNHPSIIIWSLGNEATYRDRPTAPYTNYSMYATSQYIRKRDQSRMIKYERDNRQDIVDIRSVQYPSYRGARSIATATEISPGGGNYQSNSDLRMPFLMSEYIHQMGNSGGGLFEYWRLFREIPQVQGGFIWDYIDQSLWMPVPKGSINMGDGRYFAYGGNWGDTHNDGEFCANGIMLADRTPKPFLNEIKYVQQEIWYTSTEADLKNGRINIKNEFLGRNTKDFTHWWYVNKDGIKIMGGSLELDIEPLTSKVVTIEELKHLAPVAGCEYILELEAVLKETMPWAKAGHVIAKEQFLLPISTATRTLAPDSKLIKPFTNIKEDNNLLVVEGADFSITFDKVSAELASIVKNGKELIARGPFINHWRHPGDNDVKSGAGSYNPTFIDSWKNSSVGKPAISKNTDSKSISIAVPSTLNNGATNKTTYTIYGNGEIVVENALSSELENYMLRIGMALELPEGFDKVAYYGRGPGENYSDRASGSMVGIYETTANEMFIPYIRPQFFGNRLDVRWITMTDSAGDGLKFSAGPASSTWIRPDLDGIIPPKANVINACASHYNDSDFSLTPQEAARQVVALPHLPATSARHLYQVPKRETVFVNIDMLQAPIGSYGGFCSERPPVEVQIPAKGTYAYSYKISPVVRFIGQ